MQVAGVPGPAGATNGVRMAPTPSIFRVKVDGNVGRYPREAVQVAEELSYASELGGNGWLWRGLDVCVHASIVLCELWLDVDGTAGGTLDRDSRAAGGIEWGDVRGPMG